MSVQFSTDHPSVTADAIKAHVDAGTTEKRAVALILRDAGYTNQAGGDAFDDLFGQAVKSGGFGNLVTGAMRDVGRGGEIESTGGGGGGHKKARELDPVQMLRDELDRERVALENVTKPVTEARAVIDRLGSEPDVFVTERLAEIETTIEALRAETKALKADPKPYIDSITEKANARVDSAVTAAGEREKVHTANIARLEAVVTALDSVNAPASA